MAKKCKVRVGEKTLEILKLKKKAYDVKSMDDVLQIDFGLEYLPKVKKRRKGE